MCVHAAEQASAGPYILIDILLVVVTVQKQKQKGIKSNIDPQGSSAEDVVPQFLNW